MKLSSICGRVARLGCAIGLTLIASRTEAAITFNFTPAGGTPANVIAGFTEASNLWKGILEDSLTVNVNISFPALGGGILGSTSISQFSSSYTNVRNSLTTDILSGDDSTSVSNLVAGANFPIWINRTADNPNGAGSATPYLDNDTNSNNNTLSIARANAKSIGLVSATSATSDGSIQFSSSVAFDFDRSNGITAGQIDFVGVAAHEIGHLLGFFSGVDGLDQSPGANETAYRATTPDLFRFSANSFAQGAGTIDFTANTVDKFFSINGGATNIAQFAEGISFGDGRQASHWKDSLGIGIMDPTASNGEFLTITENDTRLMDVIGWNRNFNKYWLRPTGGAFNTKAFWNGDVPGAIHTAIFDLPNTFTVTFTGTNRTNDRLLVTDGNVTYSLGGATYNLTAATAALPSVVVAQLSGETATMTVSGGTVSGVFGSVASAAGATGTVNVSGVTSNLNFSDTLAIGGTSLAAGGNGVLNVTASATARATNLLKIWSGGTVSMTSSTIDAGTVDIAGGRLGGTGTVDATLFNGGTVAPGNSAGLLSVVGDYTQSALGELEIEIGGLIAGTQYDRLAVTGVATLDGTLTLSLINAFVPVAGDLFDVITFASGSGTFDTVTGATFGAGPGEFFVPVYTVDDLTLYVPLAGDANFDGVVSGGDFTVWADNFGTGSTWAQGDFTGDGMVTGGDFTVWADSFGDSVTFDAISTAIPEPSGICLIVLALAATPLVVRCRRSKLAR